MTDVWHYELAKIHRILHHQEWTLRKFLKIHLGQNAKHDNNLTMLKRIKNYLRKGVEGKVTWVILEMKRIYKTEGKNSCP